MLNKEAGKTENLFLQMCSDRVIGTPENKIVKPIFLISPNVSVFWMLACTKSHRIDHFVSLKGIMLPAKELTVL